MASELEMREAEDTIDRLNEQIAALKAENERLAKALSEQIDRDISGVFPAERALAERAGGVGAERRQELSRYLFQVAKDRLRGGDGFSVDDPMMIEAAAILGSAALTTEPAAREGQQDEEPEALRKWREDQIERVRDGSFLTRPAEQAVTEEMVECALKAIHDNPAPWPELMRAALTAGLAQKEVKP